MVLSLPILVNGTIITFLLKITSKFETFNSLPRGTHSAAHKFVYLHVCITLTSWHLLAPPRPFLMSRHANNVVNCCCCCYLWIQFELLYLAFNVAKAQSKINILKLSTHAPTHTQAYVKAHTHTQAVLPMIDMPSLDATQRWSGADLQVPVRVLAALSKFAHAFAFALLLCPAPDPAPPTHLAHFAHTAKHKRRVSKFFVCA